MFYILHMYSIIVYMYFLCYRWVLYMHFLCYKQGFIHDYDAYIYVTCMYALKTGSDFKIDWIYKQSYINIYA